ncbi:hypothetical protein AMJ71_07605 [candidate division TA06 bacterium SM1_40]|uniref:3-keto-disaccharide hydrolase domain-containing protein n=1 Tax=candidate division TA06 bacterium SM1_40 TaxID=1703773 RepID=A0A0S8JH12_UNCT6|nr:MAG: hypothetical protein AMJ71_07605 [candidate division TA06 bacterium SM1_40]
MLRIALVVSCAALLAVTAFAQVPVELQTEEPEGDPDLQFLLNDGTYRYKIDVTGGKITGTCIDEPWCHGGDIRGLYEQPGEFAIVAYNLGRYDYNNFPVTGFLLKGALHYPPATAERIWEFTPATSTVTLDYDVADAWFHESVNDGGVQGWVAVGPQWMIAVGFGPSPSYDYIGTGINDWSDTYYTTYTYPRPGDAGYQYEALLRKTSGSNSSAMALYFNTDMTLNNGVSVQIAATGRCSAWEWVGGTPYMLIGWTDSPHLYKDDTAQDGANAWNLVKVNVEADGTFDIYFNEEYAASAQASTNLSGYVGFRIYDSNWDWVSCDNMTLSTESWDGDVVRGEIHRARPAGENDPAVAPH